MMRDLRAMMWMMMARPLRPQSDYVWSSTPWTSNQANFHAIGHFTQASR